MKRALITLLMILALVGLIGTEGSWAATLKAVKATGKELARSNTQSCSLTATVCAPGGFDFAAGDRLSLDLPYHSIAR